MQSDLIQKRVVSARMLAEEHGWVEIDFQWNIQMISFVKRDMRINVYLSKMTVGTVVNHPKHGRTQLFRRNVSDKMMAAIFNDPRTHTSIGYFERKHDAKKVRTNTQRPIAEIVYSGQYDEPVESVPWWTALGRALGFGDTQRPGSCKIRG